MIRHLPTQWVPDLFCRNRHFDRRAVVVNVQHPNLSRCRGFLQLPAFWAFVTRRCRRNLAATSDGPAFCDWTAAVTVGNDKGCRDRVSQTTQKTDVMPVGVVLRRSPGVTRWAKWNWTVSGLLPAASAADWQLLRSEGGVREYHAATLPLELHRAEAEAYMQALTTNPPSVYVILREASEGEFPLEVTLITASPFEAQDYADSGEELVEKVAMPSGLVAWLREFTLAHFQEEEFKKRRRDNKDIGGSEDGIGDPRIAQLTDVYRSPSLAKKGRIQ